MKALLWSDEAAKGEMYDTVDIPADHAEAAREWRDRLVETVAENDDALMELYLEGTEPTEEQLVAAIRRATLASELTPVLTGSAFKNKGVQPMLDAVVAYLPVADRRRGHRGPRGRQGGRDHRAPRRPERAVLRAGLQDRERPAPGQAHLHPHLLGHARDRHRRCSTPRRASKERIGKIYRMHANKREERPSATAGQIVAVMGLKDTTTGDTLCDPANRSSWSR